LECDEKISRRFSQINADQIRVHLRKSAAKTFLTRFRFQRLNGNVMLADQLPEGTPILLGGFSRFADVAMI
jgi:hypothetical protein